MHDARPERPANCGQTLTSAQPVQQRGNESAGVSARAWMHDHSRWFIYDSDVLVFVNDIERNIFRFHAGKRGRWNIYGNSFAGFKTMRGLLRKTIPEHSRVVD